MRRERFQRERDITEQLELAGELQRDVRAAERRVARRRCATECEQFLRDTQAMWDDVAAGVRRSASSAWSATELTRADALALFRAPRVRRVLSGERRWRRRSASRCARWASIRCAAGRIMLDTGEREGKRSRAFCAPVRVPDEVYLVLRPHGGQTDWTTFLHELGHALHFAYMRPDLSVRVSLARRQLDHRRRTRCCSTTCMQDAGMAAALHGARRADAADVPARGGLRGAAFPASLLREADLRDRAVRRRACRGSRCPISTSSTLTAATTFRYDRADAFVDVDPRYYAARYLRAWQLQALIAETLVERYDEDWWRNPRAGPWIVRGAVRRRAARAGARAGGAGDGAAAVVRAARARDRGDARVGLNITHCTEETGHGKANRARHRRLTRNRARHRAPALRGVRHHRRRTLGERARVAQEARSRSAAACAARSRSTSRTRRR